MLCLTEKLLLDIWKGEAPLLPEEVDSFPKRLVLPCLSVIRILGIGFARYTSTN
jgi:hypothetical protein